MLQNTNFCSTRYFTEETAGMSKQCCRCRVEQGALLCCPAFLIPPPWRVKIWAFHTLVKSPLFADSAEGPKQSLRFTAHDMPSPQERGLQNKNKFSSPASGGGWHPIRSSVAWTYRKKYSKPEGSPLSSPKPKPLCCLNVEHLALGVNSY